MNFIEMLIPVFVFFILIEIIMNLLKKTEYYSIPDTITDMSLGIISRLTDIFVLVFMYQIYAYLQNNYSLASSFQFSLFHFNFSSDWYSNVWAVLSFGVLFLLVDFLFYWNHRFSHEINILWASHVAHHSSQEYNLTVALRQSFLRNAIALIFYMFFAFFGIPWMVLLLTDALNRLYQFWVHTRFLKRLPRWFEFLFVTPSHHRVHHARNPKYLDKNYAGVFIFWDRLFGTFEEEAEEPIYGIVKPLKTFDPIRANLHVYREIFKIILSPLSLKLKTRALFSKPDFMSTLNQSLPYSLSGEITPPKTQYNQLTFKKNIGSVLVLLFLIALSLLLIKSSVNLNFGFAIIFYFALLGGYGMLGNYLDRQVSRGF